MSKFNSDYQAFKIPDRPETNFNHELPRDLSKHNAGYLSETDEKLILIFGSQRYYNLFSAQLGKAAVSKTGKLKNPIIVLNPVELLNSSEDPEAIQFFASLIKFQNFYQKSPSDIKVVENLLANPFKLDVYYHDPQVSEKPNAQSLSRINLKIGLPPFNVHVSYKNKAYTVRPILKIDDVPVLPNAVVALFDLFLIHGQTWYFSKNSAILNSITYFKKHPNLVLSKESYELFKHDVLKEVEKDVNVFYEYIKPANSDLQKKFELNEPPEKIIYLGDLGNYISIEPCIRYGNTEVLLLSKQQITTTDEKGKAISLKRNIQFEDEFLSLLSRQHPHFQEQVDNPFHHFYLHKNRFLNDDWFLNAYTEWGKHQIKVLGFNEIKGNKLNLNPANISINVESGLNWFNINIKARFGNQNATIRQLQKAIKKRSRYVQLDDGSLGILPEEWLQKFDRYFNSADISGNDLRIAKANFEDAARLLDEEDYTGLVKSEIEDLRHRLSNFNSIKTVSKPQGLMAELRPYQQQGLNWLNFLDDFNFGGCLADDMGLGKSLQIIAFILLLKQKHGRATHLLVVPTSVVHNWEIELKKFAPGIKYLIHQGADRTNSTELFKKHSLIITSYHIMSADITFLKNHAFDYIFLDESQNIKNPSSQRYRSALMLQSRNKIVITGTPLENNILDIYAQISFAVPGLLGNTRHFKHTYATTIEKFGKRHSIKDLQNKIKPFILRRNKAEVAKELPSKIEQIIYCDMDLAQRKVYEDTEKHFRDFLEAKKSEDLHKETMYVLRGITKLRQICDSPLLLNDDKLKVANSVKIEVLMEQVLAIAPRHKILIFSQFVGMLELIKTQLEQQNIPYTWLSGTTKNRGEVVHRFQNDDATRIFLISLKAGGTGLNLTAAEYVFIVDPWWNPSVENQAIDRAYRIGQLNNVIATRLICRNTVEEKIMELQETKKSLSADLINTGSEFFKTLTRTELIRLFKS